MRRVVTILLACGLVTSAISAPAVASKRKPKKAAVRTVELRYDNPAFGIGGGAGGCYGCPELMVESGERYAMIMIEDDVSPTGYVAFDYDADGDGLQDFGSGPVVCGHTDDPVEVVPDTAYTSWPWLAGNDCLGAASFSGAITVMLSNDADALEAAAGHH